MSKNAAKVMITDDFVKKKITCMFKEVQTKLIQEEKIFLLCGNVKDVEKMEELESCFMH